MTPSAMPNKVSTSAPRPDPRHAPAFVHDDVTLVRALGHHQPAALTALHARYAARLHRRARRLVRHHEDAADLVQEVFLQVWRTAAAYDPRRGSVEAWLMMLLRSRAIDQLRWRRVHQPGAAPRPGLDHSRTAHDPLPVADVLTVHRACRALPSGQRAVVELAYFQGLTCTETADALDIPVGTMKWRMASALDGLRAQLS
jgi:RNA polymerase sigma-70 factor (ECF subfamily)